MQRLREVGPYVGDRKRWEEQHQNHLTLIRNITQVVWQLFIAGLLNFVVRPSFLSPFLALSAFCPPFSLFSASSYFAQHPELLDSAPSSSRSLIESPMDLREARSLTNSPFGSPVSSPDLSPARSQPFFHRLGRSHVREQQQRPLTADAKLSLDSAPRTPSPPAESASAPVPSSSLAGTPPKCVYQREGVMLSGHTVIVRVFELLRPWRLDFSVFEPETEYEYTLSAPFKQLKARLGQDSLGPGHRIQLVDELIQRLSLVETENTIRLFLDLRPLSSLVRVSAAGEDSSSSSHSSSSLSRPRVPSAPPSKSRYSFLNPGNRRPPSVTPSSGHGPERTSSSFFFPSRSISSCCCCSSNRTRYCFHSSTIASLDLREAQAQQKQPHPVRS